MIVNQLVTLLKFKMDPRGANDYDKRLGGVQRTARSLLGGLVSMFKGGTQGANEAAKAARSFRDDLDSLFRTSKQGADEVAKSTQYVRDKNGRLRDEHGRFVEDGTKGIAGLIKGYGGLGKTLMSLTAGYASLQGMKKLGEELFNAVGTKQGQLGRLETLMGSKPEALKQYRMLQKQGEATPFEATDLINGFSTIKGSGYQLTKEDITGLGDVVSGSGKTFPEMVEMLKGANRGLGNMVDNFDGLKATAKDGSLHMERFDKQLKQWVSKDIKAGDMAGFVKFVRTHGERNYKGEMDRQSKTLPGLMSTVKDRLHTRLTDIGDAGMEKVMTGAMNWLVDFTGKLEPMAKSFGRWAAITLPQAMRTLIAMKPLLPLLATGLTAMVSVMAGNKVIGFAKGLWETFKVIKAMSMGALLGGWPMLIGAVVVAVGYLGYEIFKFATTGKGLIKDLGDKFPWFKDVVAQLGDSFKQMQPILSEIWQNITIIGDALLTGLAPIVQAVFSTVIMPLITAGLQLFANWLKDWINGYKIMRDAYNLFIADWNAGYQVLKPGLEWLINGAANFGNTFTTGVNGALDAIKRMVPALGPLIDAFKTLFGLSSESSSGSPGVAQVGMAGFNTVLGDRIAKSANATATSLNSVNRCAFGVETALNKLGINFTGHAYQLKDQLDKDKRFQRVQVSDEQMTHLPAGTIVVHGRNLGYRGPGLGGKYGHVSVALGNGMEASDHIQRQMIHHYAGGDRYVYIPKGPGTMPAPVGARPASGTQGGNVIHVDARGATNPAAVKKQAEQGVGRALNNAALSKTNLKSPKR